MKKFYKHLDHIIWVSKPENIEANVAILEKLTDSKLTPYERRDLGLIVYMSWEAGLEVTSPIAERTDVNEALYKHLETKGEGVYAIVFGVRDVDGNQERLEALGFKPGSEVGSTSAAPWADTIKAREIPVCEFMNSLFAIGEIHYRDDVLEFGEA